MYTLILHLTLYKIFDAHHESISTDIIQKAFVKIKWKSKSVKITNQILNLDWWLDKLSKNKFERIDEKK